MSADAHIAPKAAQQLMHQQTQYTALFRCTGILRIALRIQSAFIADADAVSVHSLDMRPYKGDGTGICHCTVTADIIVVTDIAETAAQVFRTKGFYRKRTVLPGGAAMHHDVVYLSHNKKNNRVIK